MASAIRNLTERRVPQVLAIYLGAAFGVVQFVDFVGSRYTFLPPVWTDLVLLTMALLLPSVLLYTYNHGRPGPDEWRKSERIFIPANLALLLVAVLFVGAGESFGPTARRITVKDEKGNTREAVVPNKAYRKRVALFMFDAARGDTAAQWLQYGLPLLTTEDLAQQNFIEAMQPAFMQEGLRKSGIEKGVGAPLTLKREVAREMHIPHFVAGKVAKVGAEYVATVQLYETETLKLIKENQFRSLDAAQLADQVSAALVRDMNIPNVSDAAPEMPVAEVLSTNPLALRNYAEAAAAVTIDNDFARGFAHNSQAIQLDNTFASAHMLQASLAMFTGQPQLVRTSVKTAMDHSYRLPERSKELIKASFYNSQGDYVRAFAVLDMLAQMYPEDIQVQQLLLQVHQVRNDRDAMVRTMEKILELDPSRAELMLQLGMVYEQKGESKQALEQYAAYEKKSSRDPRGPRQAAQLHRKLGAHAAAKAAFEKALLIKPDDPETLVQLAVLERHTGNFAAARERLDEAMNVARTPAQRATVLIGMADLQSFRGDIRGGFKMTEAALVEEAKYQAPAILLIERMKLPAHLARVDVAAGQRELSRLHNELKAPWDIYLPIADMQFYLEAEDVAGAEAAVNALDALIAKQNFKIFQAMADYGRGKLLELKGDCQGALRYYAEELKSDPLDASTHTAIGRCYRKLGQLSKAEAELKASLRVVPAQGMANLEMGLLYKQAGDLVKARASLQRALDTWQNADANYKPARSAREALSALK